MLIDEMHEAIAKIEASLASSPRIIQTDHHRVKLTFDGKGWTIEVSVRVRTKSGRANQAKNPGRAWGSGDTLEEALSRILGSIELLNQHPDLV